MLLHVFFLKLLPLFFKVIAHIEGTNSTLQLPIVELLRTVTFIGQQYNTFIISSNNTALCRKACIIYQCEISVQKHDMYLVSCYLVVYVWLIICNKVFVFVYFRWFVEVINEPLIDYSYFDSLLSLFVNLIIKQSIWDVWNIVWPIFHELTFLLQYM